MTLRKRIRTKFRVSTREGHLCEVLRIETPIAGNKTYVFGVVVCCGGRRRMLAIDRRRVRPSAVVRNPWQGALPDLWAVGNIQPDEAIVAGRHLPPSAPPSQSNGAPRALDFEVVTA